MEEKKRIVPDGAEIKGYSANQSVDISKGYNGQTSMNVRNDVSNKKQDFGYCGQQIAQTVNTSQSQQTNQGNKTSKKTDGTK